MHLELEKNKINSQLNGSTLRISELESVQKELIATISSLESTKVNTETSLIKLQGLLTSKTTEYARINEQFNFAKVSPPSYSDELTDDKVELLREKGELNNAVKQIQMVNICFNNIFRFLDLCG